MASERRPTTTVSKRKAASRRRVRDLGRKVFAYGIVAILVLSSFSTFFVPQVLVQPEDVASVPTVPQQNAGTFDALLAQGDEAASAGQWNQAITLYSAYLGQETGSAEANFKLGKAYANVQPPDYPAAVDYLQRALNISPTASFAAEASELAKQYTALITPTVPVTETVPLTTTSTVTSTTASTAITATIPATP